MNRMAFFLTVAAGSIALSGCGGSPLVVQAALETEVAEGAAGSTMVLSNLPIRLLPYDRDAVFDSLTRVAPRPEPEVPASLRALQDSVIRAQEEWQNAEVRWGVVRDSLRQISEELRELSRGSAQYVVLFRTFNQLEPVERQMKQRMDAAFARFTNLQAQVGAQAEEARIAREAWEDEAYADVEAVFAERLKAMNREEMADTTNANGVATFRPRSGQWWVYARYELPYSELYWNVPVRMEGDQVEVRLTRQNAEVRPKL
jgi:hypothetical protein